MPITGDLLGSDLRQVGELAAQVRGPVNDLLGAARDANSTLTVDAGVAAVQRAVDEWATVTEGLEQRLRSHALEYPADRFDAEARLGGIALMHVSLAADVAALVPFDGVPASILVAAAATEFTLPRRAEISLRVLETGRLLQSISEPIEQGLPRDDADAPEAEAPEAEAPKAEDPKADTQETLADFRKIAGDAVDDVMKDIVDRAGTACSSVVLGLSGIAVHAVHPLSEALNLAPGFITEALRKQAKKIAGLVKFLVNRANEIFNAILGNYREVLAPLQDQITSALTEPLGARLVGKLVDDDKVRADAKQRLCQARDVRERDRRIERMEKLKTLHARWVGPVRIVADGLPLLTPVMVGPVPSVAIAAVGLLGWTVFVTGDQLDTSRKFFPDLWPGVVRRAGDE
jgi:hypothetical protein